MGWQLLDFRVFDLTATFEPLTFPSTGSALVASMSGPPVSGGQLWRVERVSCQVFVDPTLVSATPISCTLYDQEPGLLGFQNVGPPVDDFGTIPVANVAPADQTMVGQIDISDDGSPITVLEGNAFTALFVTTAQAVGASVALLRLQVAIMGGTAGQPTPVAGSSPAPTVPASI